MGVRGSFLQRSLSRWRLAWHGAALVAACIVVNGLTAWRLMDGAAPHPAAVARWQGEAGWAVLAMVATTACFALLLAAPGREFGRHRPSACQR